MTQEPSEGRSFEHRLEHRTRPHTRSLVRVCVRGFVRVHPHRPTQIHADQEVRGESREQVENRRAWRVEPARGELGVGARTGELGVMASAMASGASGDASQPYETGVSDEMLKDAIKRHHDSQNGGEDAAAKAVADAANEAEAAAAAAVANGNEGAPSAAEADAIRHQLRQEAMGGLTKEEEEERSRRNQEMLPAGKTLGHMTIEERWDFARKYKDAGNVFFKEGKYEFALKNYQETITYLRHGLRMGESQDEGVPMGARQRDVDPEAKSIMLSCYANMAACALKTSQFDKVVRFTSTALDDDALKRPDQAAARTKAFFRRSKAHDALGNVEAAFEDIHQAKASMDGPGDAAVRAHYAVVVKKYKALKKEEHIAAKALWQGKLKAGAGIPDADEKASKAGERGGEDAGARGTEGGHVRNLRIPIVSGIIGVIGIIGGLFGIFRR